jgi:hypothetical protein
VGLSGQTFLEGTDNFLSCAQGRVG